MITKAKYARNMRSEAIFVVVRVIVNATARVREMLPNEKSSTIEDVSLSKASSSSPLTSYKTNDEYECRSTSICSFCLNGILKFKADCTPKTERLFSILYGLWKSTKAHYSYNNIVVNIMTL